MEVIKIRPTPSTLSDWWVVGLRLGQIQSFLVRHSTLYSPAQVSSFHHQVRRRRTTSPPRKKGLPPATTNLRTPEPRGEVRTTWCWVTVYAQDPVSPRHLHMARICHQICLILQAAQPTVLVLVVNRMLGIK